MKNITKLDWVRTLYCNFKWLPFRDALKLPILVYRRTKLLDMSGEVVFTGPISRGMLRIGEGCLSIKDRRYERTILDISGRLEVRGRAHFACGSRVSINKGCCLSLGDNFNTTGNVTIVCGRGITFGNDCLLSWDILVMDSDFHTVLRDGVAGESSAEIRIGHHVWVGCRSTILKGTELPDNSIVGANTTVAKRFEIPGSIIAGSPAQTVATNTDWVK